MSVESRDLAGAIRQAFGTMSVTCSAHIRSLRSNQEAGVLPDHLFVAASVFKVAVALEFYRQVAAGELDPAEPVRTAASERTAGPTGLSMSRDDAVTSLRDLATSMMVVSDNAATDVLLERVTIERVKATLASLGIRETYIAYDMAGLLARMIAESGLATWGDVLRMDPNYDTLQSSTVLRAETTTRTTARDMTTLLCAVWTDAAGTPRGVC
jgi:beta-lactamase class A